MHGERVVALQNPGMPVKSSLKAFKKINKQPTTEKTNQKKKKPTQNKKTNKNPKQNEQNPLNKPILVCWLVPNLIAGKFEREECWTGCKKYAQ